MISYGTGPGSDELEVVVFGPGYGEAIAVHLGDHHWLLADSCIDPLSKAPASLTYLKSIGVAMDSVKVVVATHWHDDHVRGFAEIIRSCPSAELQISGALNSDEARALLAAYSGRAAPALTRGTRELFEAVELRDDVYHLHHRSSICEFVLSDGRNVRVAALSPSQAAITRSVSHLAQFLPAASGQQSIANITPLAPNGESVVIHVDFGSEAVLLGADLEDHADYGWTAIASDTWTVGRRKAAAYKVAHHGSHTGDCARVWATLLLPAPVAAVTPFNKGNQRLPTETDRARLKLQAGAAFISSRAGSKPRMDAAAAKRLGDVVKNLAPVNNGFGAVRLRKAVKAQGWTVTCFGDAHQM